MSQPNLAELDKSVGILTLISTDIHEKPVWALVSLYPSKVEEYEAKASQYAELVITDYGRIVESGWGLIPDKNEQKHLSEKYGADFRFVNMEK